MAGSERFEALSSRLEVLRTRFLPADFSPTGEYSEEERDFALGYRVLVHAEIEAYLEDVCIETLGVCVTKWELDRKPRRTTEALLAYAEIAQPATPDTHADARLDRPIRARVSAAKDAYVNKVRRTNHGIREQNILQLLLPVGVAEHELDPVWIGTLDAFGGRRGDTSHSAVSAQQPPSPSEELASVEQILSGLETVDALLGQLRDE